ncbi:MAG TPA: I78 family peptidase inhibitor [Sphingomicrobium sp.]|nr:I78 family peptidase inhibitor [Sphingomicrobium sp.]
MIKFLSTAALALVLTACGSGNSRTVTNPLILPPAYGTPSQPVQASASTRECSNSGLDRFRGQPGTSATGSEMLRVSGAQTIRWVQPGQAVTMDFSPQRLTVYLAKGSVIDRANCG